MKKQGMIERSGYISPDVAALVLVCFLAQCLASAQPLITLQPVNQTNAVGTTATFTVAATGTGELAYQWQKGPTVWSDLPARTNASLILSNVQTGDAIDYRAVVTDETGATNSNAAHLYVLVSPRIISVANLQNTALSPGSDLQFSVSASGTAPLRYQWLKDGSNLAWQTNSTLTLLSIQPTNEGDYTVVVANLAGAVTNDLARLWVVPTAEAFITNNFFNQSGVRLPYFYLLPTNYTAARRYPLLLYFHGTPGDETMIKDVTPTLPGYANLPGLKVFASFRQQEIDPMILLWPARRAGDKNVHWTNAYYGYMPITSQLLDQFISTFSVDTNRIYVCGYSGGVCATCDIIGMRPGLFAGAAVGCGYIGGYSAAAIKDMPFWIWASKGDSSQLTNTQNLVTALRGAGGNAIYTEYGTPVHLDAILMGCCNPVFVHWLLSQRQGQASTSEPSLAITNPTCNPTHITARSALTLAGTAKALGWVVTNVVWTNTVNSRTGTALGTNVWCVTNLTLVTSKTNLIIVTATTTSWCANYGGNTTFNDTLKLVWSPIRANLSGQGTEAVLTWVGGAGPYSVQRATDLINPEWETFLTDAESPLTVPIGEGPEFFRVVGQ